MRKQTIINPDTGQLIATFPGSDNDTMLKQRQAALDRIAGPKVGDYLRTRDGKLLRFTIDHGDRLQAYWGGSFYLGPNGCDFSGACGDSYPTYRMILTGQRKQGSVWFFDGDHWRAGGGHDTKATFNVWEELEDIFLNDYQWKQRALAATKRMISAVATFGIDNYNASAIY